MAQEADAQIDLAANNAQADGTDGTDEDIHAVPDVELLQFHKQRSTPKVRLSEVGLDGDENVIAEIDDFANVNTGAAQMGMAQAGSEE